MNLGKLQSLRKLQDDPLNHCIGLFQENFDFSSLVCWFSAAYQQLGFSEAFSPLNQKVMGFRIIHPPLYRPGPSRSTPAAASEN